MKFVLNYSSMTAVHHRDTRGLAGSGKTLSTKIKASSNITFSAFDVVMKNVYYYYVSYRVVEESLPRPCSTTLIPHERLSGL